MGLVITMSGTATKLLRSGNRVLFIYIYIKLTLNNGKHTERILYFKKRNNRHVLQKVNADPKLQSLPAFLAFA